VQQDAINRFRESPDVLGCVDPIIVNTTGDQDDGDPNDGVCDVDPNQTGNQCTLRAALEEANLRGGGAFVAFRYSGWRRTNNFTHDTVASDHCESENRCD